MKKILALVCMLMLGIGFAQAQVNRGESAVGVNLVYGTEIESMGLGARFQYGIIDHLRAEVGFNGFFAHKHTTWWDVNLNAHYLLGLWHEQFYFYPLVGLNYTMTTHKENGISDEENHVGLNVGAGLEYELNDHFGTNLEFRHTIVRKGLDQAIIGVGLNYKF